MEHLYVLRHGIAVPHGTPGVPEDDRPLTDEGEAELRKVAKGLKRLKLGVERVVTSPLPRARRTAEIVAGKLGGDGMLEESDLLRPGGSPRDVRDWLGTRSEGTLMVVGHNPDLTELVALLIGLPVNHIPFELKKGGVAALQASADGGFGLSWLATPRLLRKLLD